MSAVGHWKMQRLSSVVLVPMTAWLLWAVVSLSGSDHAAAAAFMSGAFNALMTLAVAAVTLYHTVLGIQVIVEDYVPSEGMASGLMWVTRIGCVLGFAVVAWSVYTLSFGA